MVSPQKASSLEIGNLFSFGKDQTEGGATEVGNTEENEIPDKAMVVYNSDGVEEEQWQMSCSISYRVGEMQANPLVSKDAYWEAPTPLNSLHPRSNIHISDWVLDKAK